MLITLLLACEDKKPTAGKVCPVQDHGKWTCSDSKNALYCDAGKYIAIPCRGPEGCTGKPTEASCDATIGRVDDPCVEMTFPPTRCTEDKKARLECAGGRAIVELQCKGPKGCSPGASRQPLWESCDRTIVDERDPCNVSKDARESPWGACSADGKRMLKCSEDDEKGVFKITGICHGPKGCSAKEKGDGIACDRSIVPLGATCTDAERSLVTCSEDGKMVLQCEDAKYGPKETCAPKKKCGSAYPGADLSCVASNEATAR